MIYALYTALLEHFYGRLSFIYLFIIVFLEMELDDVGIYLVAGNSF